MQKVIIAIVVAIIIYIAYRKIFVAKFDANKLPSKGSELPASWISQKKYVPYADRLWKALDGVSFSWFFSKEMNTLSYEILQLTDEQIIVINDYYNKVYGKSDGNTLVERISDEWGKDVETVKLLSKLINLDLK